MDIQSGLAVCCIRLDIFQFDNICNDISIAVEESQSNGLRFFRYGENDGTFIDFLFKIIIIFF
jgi:hypothetical protein